MAARHAQLRRLPLRPGARLVPERRQRRSPRRRRRARCSSVEPRRSMPAGDHGRDRGDRDAAARPFRRGCTTSASRLRCALGDPQAHAAALAGARRGAGATSRVAARGMDRDRLRRSSAAARALPVGARSARRASRIAACALCRSPPCRAPKLRAARSARAAFGCRRRRRERWRSSARQAAPPVGSATGCARRRSAAASLSRKGRRARPAPARGR